MLFSHVVMALAAVGIAEAAAVSRSAAFVCEDGSPGTLLSSSVVNGKELTVHFCPLPANRNTTAAARSTEVAARDADANYNLVGAPCTTYCYTPAGGGPDPNDCQSLANDYAGDGDFTIGSGGGLVWSLGSCQVVQWNDMSSGDVLYNYNTANWAGVVSYIAWNCQATQNAHGGTCNFYDSTSISNLVVQAS
ncbi:hypothetical protein PLICRDRAFT_212832 [Plicaturopsis crispa FD-325 SS-3]|nr:hypothetical protein PLICRDRAFT_212832 [Plicaturopsis crispa FD-325 SS-3]